MTFNEYQDLALRTANKLDKESLVMNGVLGLNGEAGEIADAVKKSMFQGHERDMIKLAYEIGDILWYCSIMSEGLGFDLNTIAQMNVDKLKKRYPNGFEAERSINRKD